MSLQAAEFFAELCLPFHDHTVVGNTYFAVPVPGAPMRLRIDFSHTIRAETYGGLRLAVVHPDRGEIDAVALSFLDHGTFHRRDEATNTRPNTKQYGTFDTYNRPDRPPWDGAVTTGLRRRHRAIHRRLVPRRLDRVRTQPHDGAYRAQGRCPAAHPQRCPHPLTSPIFKESSSSCTHLSSEPLPSPWR